MLLFSKKVFSLSLLLLCLFSFPATGMPETPLATPAEISLPAATETTLPATENQNLTTPPPSAVPTFQDVANDFSYPRYFKAIGILVVLICVLWAALVFLRKRGNLLALSNKKGIQNFQIESQLALGPKKALMVVNFNHEHFIIGVTDTSINFLAARPIRNYEGTDDVQENDLFTQYVAEHTTVNSTKNSGATE